MESMAILTTTANATVAPLHDRMPVIIARADFSRWLDCSQGDTEQIRDLLKPAPDDLLETFPVESRLNNPRLDGPDLVRRTNLP